jgi:hypothetical protein
MRSFVTTTFALALALAPAAVFAQAPAGQQPPAGQPPAGQPPAAEQPAAPAQPEPIKVGFTGPAGLLLVQVKPDQTATFEEMMGKIQSGIANATDPKIKDQAGAWKYYKASEPAGQNVMYIVLINPAKPDTEYQFLEVLDSTLTHEEKINPATRDMYQRYAAAIASMNKLNITPMGQ